MFEGLYVNGEPNGFGRWFTSLGDRASALVGAIDNKGYRCEIGYFEGRALHGKGKVYFKLVTEAVEQRFEGLYSPKKPSWFFNAPVKNVTITSFEENELPK
jgi:hypothetical protein